MADVQISTNESQEDIVSFFTGFSDLLEQLDSDADNFVTEFLGKEARRLLYQFAWNDFQAGNW